MPGRQLPPREVGLDDDDGFDAGDSTGDARELARVADGFEIEADGLRGRILLPILEEVVAGEVGAVAGGDEGGDAQSAGLRCREQSGAQRSGLAEEAERTGGRKERGQGGVERDVGGLVDQSEGVRPDHTHSVGAGRRDHAALEFGPGGTGLGESGGDDEHGFDAVHGTVLDHLGDGFGRNGDDREVGLARQIGEARIRLDSGDLIGFGVDDPQVAGELRGRDVADEQMAGGVAFAAGADHRHRGGVEDRAHAQGLGPVLPRRLHFDGPCRGIDIEVHGHDAVVESAGDFVAGGLEDLQHRTVLGQHLGGEALDPGFARGRGQVLQQDRTDPAALVGIGDVERHLGVGVADPVEATAADDVIADEHDQRHPVAVVDVDEAIEIALRQPGQRSEEAQIDGFR